MNSIKFKKIIMIVILLITTFLTTNCASFYHGYLMRGVIIDSTGKDIYLCIGKKDGAKEGQVFNVYKIIKTARQDCRAKMQPCLKFYKEKMGTVKISEIVDDHFAKAVVLSGKVEPNYIVEVK